MKLQNIKEYYKEIAAGIKAIQKSRYIHHQENYFTDDVDPILNQYKNYFYAQLNKQFFNKILKKFKNISKEKKPSDPFSDQDGLEFIINIDLFVKDIPEYRTVNIKFVKEVCEQFRKNCLPSDNNISFTAYCSTTHNSFKNYWHQTYSLVRNRLTNCVDTENVILVKISKYDLEKIVDIARSINNRNKLKDILLQNFAQKSSPVSIRKPLL